MAQEKYILTIACPDTVGIVAAVSGYLAKHDAFISESVHYGDASAQRFFMRRVFGQGGDGWPEKSRRGACRAGEEM